MTTPNLPALADILDPAIEQQSWMLLNKYNADAKGIPQGPFDEILARYRVSAEWANGITRQIRDVGRYFRGTAMPTALKISSYFGLPVFTTAARPAAHASNIGRLLYDSDLDAVFVDTGGAWQEIGAAPPVQIYRESFGFVVSSSGAWAVPFGSFQTENSPNPIAYNIWHVPYAGRITGVRLQTTANGGDVTARFRDASQNLLEEDTQTLASFSFYSVTNYQANHTFALDVNAGDMMALFLTFTGNPSNVMGWINLERTA